MFRTVLLPTDSSNEAVEAAVRAVELSSHADKRLVLLSVLSSNRSQPQQLKSGIPILNPTSPSLGRLQGACDVIEREGTPAPLICAVADELNVDVIVIGARGVNLRRDTTSTAALVIQHAPCPVLVVP